MPAGEVGSQGVPLGVATAILEIEISQLTRAERALAATIQNIAKSQELLLKGDQALQASAKTTLGILQQQSKVTGGSRSQQARQETRELQTQATLSNTILRSEQQRVGVAQQTTKALQEQTQQLQRQGAIADRLAAAARIRQAAEQQGSFVGQLRQDAFGGGLPKAAGGRGGFGAGNPNIPTFAQFGLFPFAGLAGSLGASGLQQGILGASSVLGIAELGSFRNAITRLGTQLQGLGGIFGTLATGGARAAQTLGAQSGGLVASLGAIGAAAAPLVGVLGAIVLLTQAIAEWQKKITDVTTAIQDFNQQAAEGATSGEIQGQVDEARRRQELDRQSQQAFQQLLADFQASIPQGFESGADRQQRVAPLNQRLSQLTGGQFSNIESITDQFAIQQIIGNFGNSIAELGVTIATGESQLQSSAIAANDLAEQQDLLTRAQLEAAQAAKELTNAQIDQKIAEFRQQADQIYAVFASGAPISEEYRAELQGQAENLERQIQVYNQLKSPLRDFVVLLTGAAKELPDFVKGVANIVENFRRQNERQAQDEALQDQRKEEDRNRQRIRALEDFSRETRDAEEQFQTQRQRVIEDAARADQELIEEAAERRLELIEDANEREQELEDDHQKRIAKILRDGRTRILEAAARLDARGVLETQRRLRDQIQEENERRDEAREDLQERLAEQLADLEENLQKQRERRAEDLQRRLQDMDREFAIQQQRRRDDFFRRLQQEDQERAFQDQREAQDRALRRQRQFEDFNRQIADQLQHYTNLNQIQSNGLEFLRQGFQNFFIQAAQTIPTGTTGGSGSLGGGGGSPAFITPFAQGIGRVPNDMIAALHAGERVLTPLQNAEYQRGGRGTVIVNINGDLGNNAAPAVRDAAEQGVEAAMEQWMWKFIGEGMNDLSNGGQ